MSNLTTEIKNLRVRLEQVNCSLEKLEKRLANTERSLDANSEVLGLFYDEKYGVPKSWKPRLYDLESETK